MSYMFRAIAVSFGDFVNLIHALKIVGTRPTSGEQAKI